MYSVKVPYKNLYGQPGNKTVFFHFFEREVFLHLETLQYVFNTIEQWSNEETRRTLDTPEVVEFYTRFEDIVLSAYGTPSDDGTAFSHDDRYKFEESSVFNAYMVMCITDTDEVGRLIKGILPEGLEEIVKKADENLIKAGQNAKDDNAQAEIERLRRELAARQEPPATT